MTSEKICFEIFFKSLFSQRHSRCFFVSVLAFIINNSRFKSWHLLYANSPLIDLIQYIFLQISFLSWITEDWFETKTSKSHVLDNRYVGQAGTQFRGHYPMSRFRETGLRIFFLETWHSHGFQIHWSKEISRSPVANQNSN